MNQLWWQHHYQNCRRQPISMVKALNFDIILNPRSKTGFLCIYQCLHNVIKIFQKLGEVQFTNLHGLISRKHYWVTQGPDMYCVYLSLKCLPILDKHSMGYLTKTIFHTLHLMTLNISLSLWQHYFHLPTIFQWPPTSTCSLAIFFYHSPPFHFFYMSLTFQHTFSHFLCNDFWTNLILIP